ncbi:uncharacterized protein O3C94_011564 [Discoglossus pictus]
MITKVQSLLCLRINLWRGCCTVSRTNPSASYLQSRDIRGTSIPVCALSTPAQGTMAKQIQARRLEGVDENIWVEFVRLADEYKTVNLGQGFPDFSPPAYVKEAFANAITGENSLLNQYTRAFGHPPLVRVIARLFGQLIGMDLDPLTNVLVTVGAYQALYCSFQALVDEGDEVILIEPFFDCYEPMVKMAGGKCVFVPLRPKPPSTDETLSSASWTLDIDELAANISKRTKLLVINTPNNPLGKVFSRQELEEIADLCVKHDIICISDEVYEWLVYDGNHHIRIASLPGMWERTITIGSGGKTFSATGWKVGWALGPDHLLKHLRTVHQNSVYHCPTAAQEGVARGFQTEWERLGRPDCYFVQLREDLQQKRDRLYRSLREVGIKPMNPQGSYFMVADISRFKSEVPPPSDPNVPYDYYFVKWLMKNKRLAAIPMSAFYSAPHKKLFDNFIRFCFVKEDSTLEAAEKILKTWSKEAASQGKNPKQRFPSMLLVDIISFLGGGDMNRYQIGSNHRKPRRLLSLRLRDFCSSSSSSSSDLARSIFRRFSRWNILYGVGFTIGNLSKFIVEGVKCFNLLLQSVLMHIKLASTLGLCFQCMDTFLVLLLDLQLIVAPLHLPLYLRSSGTRGTGEIRPTVHLYIEVQEKLCDGSCTPPPPARPIGFFRPGMFPSRLWNPPFAVHIGLLSRKKKRQDSACRWLLGDAINRKCRTYHVGNKMAEKRPRPQQETEKIDWRKQKQQRKEEKKKWREEKLIKSVEKVKEQELEKQENEQQRTGKGRQHTLSVALPGSIMDNAQSPELRTYLAGQIARACAVFCVDEIVVFDETGEGSKSVEGDFEGVGKKGQACVQLARILQYLECPQYLRKSFFPKHPDLQFAGLLNPLDSPHHVRIDEESEYREGVVLDRPTKPGKGSFVNCGMRKEVQIDKPLQAGLRVTVRLHKDKADKKVRKGVVVSPQHPRTEGGLYWGYRVRLASCLSAVFSECPFKDGYDLSVGTSEKGSNVETVTLPAFRHGLVVFGGLHGLEASVDSDQKLAITEPSVLFSYYLNTCPGQGSRTIRTEEAILISLAALKPRIEAAVHSSNGS